MAIYKYISVASVRSQGIDATMIPDNAVLNKIEEASLVINQMTGNWFTPIYLNTSINGNNSKQILLPAPLIELTESEINFSRGEQQAYIPRVGAYEPSVVLGFPDELPRPVAKYVGQGDIVSLPGDWFLRSNIAFPEGTTNVGITGYFGTVDIIKKFTTTTTVDFETDDTEITLDDLSGFTIGKTIIILNSDIEVVYSAIITDRDSGAGTITVDEAIDLDETIVSGATVITFGKIPFAIQRATMLLINELQFGIGTTDLQSIGLASRLLTERSDNYSYSLLPGDSATFGGGGTYLSSVSSLLEPFTRPPYIGAV